MCTAGKATHKGFDLIFRPHRFFGLPSLIDPMLNPNDKYNKPKIPDIPSEPVRQDYRTPVSREALAGAAARRRLIAGVATSVNGVTGEASTTSNPTPIVPIGGG